MLITGGVQFDVMGSPVPHKFTQSIIIVRSYTTISRFGEVECLSSPANLSWNKKEGELKNGKAQSAETIYSVSSAYTTFMEKKFSHDVS